MRFRTKDLCYMALMAVLIAVCSWISVQTVVPFTLQTFAVFCALELLGGARGTVAVAVYLLLGAAGVPVFAGFTGGLGILLGSTGGYLLGFLLTGLVYWLFERLGRSLWLRVAALLLGLALCYAFGTLWFVEVYSRTNGHDGAHLVRAALPAAGRAQARAGAAAVGQTQAAAEAGRGESIKNKEKVQDLLLIF